MCVHRASTPTESKRRSRPTTIQAEELSSNVMDSDEESYHYVTGVKMVRYDSSESDESVKLASPDDDAKEG